ncbi:hypothetical protein AVEN_176030-1, partial [Araneus ventricosus]
EVQVISIENEKSNLSESNNEVNFDESPIELSVTDEEVQVISIENKKSNLSDVTDKEVQVIPIENKKSNLSDVTDKEVQVISIENEKSNLNESNNEVNFDESPIESSVTDKEVQVISIENEKSNLSESNNEVNFDESPIEPSVTDKEVQVKEVCDKNKKVIDSSASNSLNAAKVRSEPEKTDFQENSYNCERPQNYEGTSEKSYNKGSTDEISSETLITDNLNCKSISVITDRGMYSKDSELYEPGVFRTPLLKYFNRNAQVDVLGISNASPSFENRIKDKQEIYVIGSEVIPDSQDKFELSLTEKSDELSNLQVSDKQLSNLKVDEILQEFSSESNIENLVEFKPVNTNLDSNPASFQLEKYINQRQVQSSINSFGLGDEMCQDNSPNKIFESPSKISVSSRGNGSDSQTIYFNSPMDIESPSEDNLPSTICLPSLDDNKQRDTSSNLPRNTNEISNEELFSNDFLRQILDNVKSTEKSYPVADISSSLNSSVDPAVKSNVIMNESVHRNLKGLFEDKPVENSNSASDVNEKKPQLIAKKFSKCLPLPRESVSKQTRNVPSYLPASYGDGFENSTKRVQTPKDALISKSGRVKISSFEEYKKRETRAMDHNPNQHLASGFPSNSSDSSPVSSNFEQNVFIPPGYRQAFWPPVCYATSLQNPSYHQTVDAYYLQDPRLARNYSVQGVMGYQPRQHLVPPPMSRHYALTHEDYSSRSVNPEFLLNPSLTIINLPPPLPPPLPPLPPPPPPPPPPPLSPDSLILEEFNSIDYNRAPSSLLHNRKTLEATKNLLVPSQSSEEFILESLLPKYLKEGVGKNIIQTDSVFLILLERKIDWIQGIDDEIGVTRISELGGEFQQVRDNYANHLVYYNTYFPLLLLECFSKMSAAMKGGKSKKKMDENICNIVHSRRKQSYVSFTCSSFIHDSEVENIPKAGHIIHIRFTTVSAGSVRILGYACSSATRAYSHRHDHAHKILKYLNVDKCRNLIKVKIKFYTVFDIPGINLDLPIYISKLTSIKKVLMLNDALNELQRSPLCDSVLSPRNRSIKSFALPRRHDTNAMTTVVQGIVQSLNPLSQGLIVVKSAPVTNSFSAIVQVIEEIQKSKLPGKILVCVRKELLNQMGMNLIETSSNLIIVKRERESLHEKLQSRVLDVMVSRWSKSGNMSDYEVKHRVLQGAKVLLVVAGTGFYKDVQCMTSDLTYGIIHDAHSLTEPESLLPLLYGIRHLLLFGDPDMSCH